MAFLLQLNIPSPVDEKEVAELKKKEAARSHYDQITKKSFNYQNLIMTFYHDDQNFRQRWRLVALVREADTEAEETARKEKLEVTLIIILIIIFIMIIITNIIIIFMIMIMIIMIFIAIIILRLRSRQGSRSWRSPSSS